jgi:hypothetical protein
MVGVNSVEKSGPLFVIPGPAEGRNPEIHNRNRWVWIPALAP